MSRSWTSDTARWDSSTMPWRVPGSLVPSPRRSRRSLDCSKPESAVAAPNSPGTPEESTTGGDRAQRSGDAEADVERAQVGVQAGVLHRQKMGRGPRLVVVAVPEPGWRHEAPPGLPVDPD